jgi:hypothetical protein
MVTDRSASVVTQTLLPVIVTPDKYDVWLDPDVTDFDAIRDILKPYDAAPGICA